MSGHKPRVNTEKSARYLSVLDGTRGLAVLIVMLSHSSGREMALAPWLDFAGIGHIGVYLFFVLSGYLLTKNLLEGQSAVQFYLRRLFRIVPLYYVVLTGVLVYQASGYYSERYLHISGNAQGALMHFLFLKGDSVFWTLACEFGFYLLLPPIVVAMGKFGWRWLFGFASVYFLAFLATEKFGVSGIPLKFVAIAHRSQFLDVFVCGILAAYLPRQRLEHPWVPALFWGLLAMSVVCVSRGFLTAHRPLYDLRWLSLLYGVVFALAIVNAVGGKLGLTKVLGNSLLAFMGRIGFGLYLLHFPVFQIVNASIDWPPYFRFFVALPIACALAWIAYRTIEHPMIRLGRRFEAKLRVGQVLRV
jgi:peptidoglycan/LPS O-acetylase OafA/YrhL